MEKQIFANKLKNARIESGHTQKEVAAIINRPQQTIAAWEVGRSQPDINTLGDLLRLYKISANSFFDFKNSKEDSISNLEMQHLKKYRALDTHGKDIVDTVLDKEYERAQQEDLVEIQLVARSGDNEIIKVTRKEFEEGLKILEEYANDPDTDADEL